jgi:hypothetical protein
MSSAQHFELYGFKAGQVQEKLGEGVVFSGGDIQLLKRGSIRIHYYPDISALYRDYPNALVAVPGVDLPERIDSDLADEEADLVLLNPEVMSD